MVDKQPTSVPKTVPEGDLIAFKKGSLEREKKLKEELANLRDELSQVKISQTDVEDDEEVKKVKEYLLSEDKRIKTQRAKLEADLTTYEKRERVVRAKELASQRGVDEETLLASEDMDTKSLELYAERLAKEKAELEEKLKSSPERIYETGGGGQLRKQPKDMSKDEFDKYWKQQLTEAQTKR